MAVHSLAIEAKHRQMPGSLASMADFSLGAGAEVDAEIVLNQPSMSLYCLDDAQKCAIFSTGEESLPVSRCGWFRRVVLSPLQAGGYT